MSLALMTMRTFRGSSKGPRSPLCATAAWQMLACHSRSSTPTFRSSHRPLFLWNSTVGSQPCISTRTTVPNRFRDSHLRGRGGLLSFRAKFEDAVVWAPTNGTPHSQPSPNFRHFSSADPGFDTSGGHGMAAALQIEANSFKGIEPSFSAQNIADH